ncbi:hypothetical protein [Massilia cavernae]|uniref:Uncharacterized protein n=1 Tax=Massilia cavernae TaxID=2320864 RepID=A0A418XB41_9BURK|nr:hypothetical protein [Massilia cavernae]RJG09578.1 hypothetical protein D3872_22050 [Massilia cavernae]
MRTLQSTWRKRAPAVVLTLAAGVLLTACNSSNDTGGGSPPPAPTPPAVVVDSFFTIVAARVASLLDQDEPVAIDTITATAPEDTEPEAVP